MKNIKYRAWDNLHKEMLYPTKVGLSGLKSHDILERFENVMQFTGLKDKNGKECYHKDIGVTPLGLKGVIEWDELRHAWIFQDEMKFNELLFYRSMDLEIIGNIFENNNTLK